MIDHKAFFKEKLKNSKERKSSAPVGVEEGNTSLP